MTQVATAAAPSTRTSTRMVRPPTYPELRASQLTGRGSWRALAGTSCIRFTYSGRAAIYQCMRALRARLAPDATRDVVLVPSFHCPTVVDPILHAGLEPRFFAIDEAMRVDAEDFLRKLDSRVAAAVFIRYFGFRGDDAPLRRACRDAGAWIIEDCSHSFLEAAPLRLAQGDADAEIYSFWKLLPTLIGGALRLHDPDVVRALDPPAGIPLRDSLQRLRAFAGHLRTPAAPHDGPLRPEPPPTPVVRKAYPDAYPYDARASDWPIPASARWILEHADLQRVLDVRRRNYTLLAERVEPSAILRPLRPQLDADTCPWGFPLMMNGRERHDYLIRARGVPVFTFGEVLHPALFERHHSEAAMLERARYLSDNVMGIAVQQDIEPAAMQTIATILGEFTTAS